LSIPYWLLAILGFALSVGTIGTILLWGSVWIRVEHWMRVVPTLRLGQALAAADPPKGRVCVVVPAYNEAGVIAALIRSLRTETYPQLRVVLALDRCRDDTASLARAGIAGDERFEIIEVDTCPAHWAAKVHAVHAGVTGSRGAADADYLLFADADTVFTPGCIAATVAMMRHGKLDMLSLLSTLTHDTWFERVVQTAAVFELMRQYPLTLANALKDRRPFANGQFMLFTRDAYAAVGGHGAVKDALLEDLALVRLIDASGRKAGVFLAAGLFHCRMYADWAEFRRGWKRIYTEAAQRKPRRLSLSARLETHLHRGRQPQAQAPVALGAMDKVARHDPARLDADRRSSCPHGHRGRLVHGVDVVEFVARRAPALAGRAAAHFDAVPCAAMDRASAHRGRMAHCRPAQRSGSGRAPA
jgi:cellulose synthase/poly-beta-1,6-N-acetylglucosamine synthase-like glycosyltransferase